MILRCETLNNGVIIEGRLKKGVKKMTRNDLCWCGSGKKYKKCHMDFDERLNAMKFNIFKGQVRPPKKIINNEMDIAAIRKSGDQ